MVIELKVTPVQPKMGSDIIRLTPPRRRKRLFRPVGIPGIPIRTLGRVLTSPTTTVALGTTLGGLVGGFPGALKGAGLATLGVTGVAAAAKSPRIRRGLKLLSPTKARERGEALGTFVEDPSGLFQKARRAAKKAAPVVAAAVLGGAAVVGARRIARRIRERRAPSIPSLPSPGAVVGALPSVSLPPGFGDQPSIAAAPPAPPAKPVPASGGATFINQIQIQNA